MAISFAILFRECRQAYKQAEKASGGLFYRKIEMDAWRNISPQLVLLLFALMNLVKER